MNLQEKLIQFILSFGNLNLTIKCSHKEQGYFNPLQGLALFIVREEPCAPWSLKDSIKTMPTLSLSELYTIAHELGHAISRRQGFHTEAASKSLFLFSNGLGGEEDFAAVFQEEERAWQYAEWVLRGMGETDFTLFNQEKEAALSSYRRAKPKQNYEGIVIRNFFNF